MTNVFDKFAGRLRNSPFVIYMSLAAIIMFFLGVIFFIEDTRSSYNGIKLVETAFQVKPVNMDITYLAISLAPQIAQIIFIYAALTNPRQYWWGFAIAFFFFVIDFISDVQDRSQMHFLPLDGGVNLDSTTYAAVLITLIFFQFCSELFLTFSAGLLLTMLPDLARQLGKLAADLTSAVNDSRDEFSKARRTHTRQAQGQVRRDIRQPGQQPRQARN